jgi:hypothetical protein
MKTILNLFLICTMGVCIISCGKEDSVQYGDGIDSDQQLIELNYVNQAWGNWFSSHFILTDGNHFYYQEQTNANNAVPEDWNLADTDGFISIDKLSDNILKADSLVQNIDVSLLADLADLSDALEEDVSEPAHICDDAGVTTVYVYTWDSSKSKFKRKLVRQCGDVAMNNNHNVAQEILDLMSTFPLAFEFFCCKD